MNRLLDEARCALPPALSEEIFDGFSRAGFRLEPGSSARTDDLVVVRAIRHTEAFQRELAAVMTSIRVVGEKGSRVSDPPTSREDKAQLEAVLGHFKPLRLPTRTWLQVWDAAKMIGTGIELHVVDDEDASSQLDALAEALTDMDRSRITIKPRRGWQDYGLPGRL